MPALTKTPLTDPSHRMSDRSRRTMWITGAATGALVVATGVRGWIALERRDEYHRSLDSEVTFGEQQRLMAEASTAQHRATFGAVTAAVMAVATAVLYLVGRR